MYKMLLSSAVLASAVLGLSQPVMANETFNGVMAQNRIEATGAEQFNTVMVKGVVTSISGGRYAPVTSGRQVISGRREVGGEMVTIRADDGREYIQRISLEAQAAAGLQVGEAVELSFSQEQLVAVSGTNGYYQVAEVRTAETAASSEVVTSSESTMSESTMSESTTTTIETRPATIETRPMIQPQPVEQVVPQMW